MQDGPFAGNAAVSETQRTWGVGGSYEFGPATVGLVYTQSRYQFAYGDGSIRFNNYEVNARYNLTPALAVGAAYTYTQAVESTLNAANTSSHWNQFGLQADYALSRRTDIYAEGVMSAGGNGALIPTQVFGTNAPSSSRNQVVVTTGLRHRF